MIGSILGEEDERPEGESPEALPRAEAFAAAIAAKLAGADPEVARDTSAFLKEQMELLKVQREHAKDEHALRLAHLRNQLREETVRRLGLRLRVGFQIFLALVATAIGAGAIVMVHDAATSRAVVIEPIDIAPNLTTRVPSGKIVAAGLLDVLERIQRATATTTEKRSLSNAWTDDISVEVPDTGISIGQLERILKTRFGHDQRIEGDLVSDKGGLALTVRGTGIPSKTFASDTSDLDALLTQAGEYVYSQSQGPFWALHLVLSNRLDEAVQFIQASYSAANSSERAKLLAAWALALSAKGTADALRDSLSMNLHAIQLDPEFWAAYGNAMSSLMTLGEEEKALRIGDEMRKAARGRPGRAPEVMYLNYDISVWDLKTLHANLTADLEAHGGIGTTSSNENLTLAQYEVQMHDVEAATLRLQTTPVDDKNLPDVAQAATARAMLAEEVGDLKAAAREWDALAAVYANPTVPAADASNRCVAAPIYEKAGQPQKADAALDSVGKLTFVDCFRFRGDVLELRRDWAGALAWYAKAVNLAPSIPSGYYSWGMALARHGDLEGAAVKFTDAHQRGPHWADPLKAWGDVLVKQGRVKEALIKYKEALNLAPNWMALKRAREAAEKQKS